MKEGLNDQATGDRFRRWSVWLFVPAVLVAMAMRAPLALNASAHLDGDLGVDGLTLLDVLHGRWRWHYPGTTHSGITPVFSSYAQALVWGATPITLVSGGCVLYAFVMLSTFLLARRAFGPGVAAWTLAPLTFCSTGLIWLSGRITGGHLLAAGWHSAALLLLHKAVSEPSFKSTLALGLWCGLGYYSDQMFLLSLAGLVPALGFALIKARKRPSAACLVALAIGFAIGIAPREIGRRADPFDAYPGQFRPSLDARSLLEHTRILFAECLPRLFSGHRLPDFIALPDRTEVQGVLLYSTFPEAEGADVWASCFGIFIAGLGLSRVWLSRAPETRNIATDVVRQALGLSCLASLGAFVINRNVFGSDNYRYLTLLIAPWAIGVGILLNGLAERKGTGVGFAIGLAAILAVTSTLDIYRWHHRFGWVSDSGMPVRKRTTDPVLDWLEEHDEVKAIRGGYWDVYRYAFLLGGRVAPLPLGYYPDRFPELRARTWSDDESVEIIRIGRMSNVQAMAAQARGGRILLQTRRTIIFGGRESR